MMKNKNNYYITTAIAYTSSKPHIGNVYEIVLADSMARYKRQQGLNVHFQTGTDEHGQKIELKAKELGITPKEHVDHITGIIRDIFAQMNISYDHFIRTTDDYHERQTQKIFDCLYQQGDIYKGKYQGWYCIPDETFYTESQVTDGKCPDCGRDLVYAEEDCYFLKLSKYQKRLEEYIESHPNFIQPESRRNEMLNNFIRPGLQDLAVSRTSFTWGIPVDFDPKHVIYVWIDALVNYITGLGYDVDGNHGPLYHEFWPANVHLIGKDILRFHTIYWPVLLMALDIPLPDQVFGHPWLLVGDGKMSKSVGNVIYSDQLVELFGVDAVRYIMLHEMPFERDGHITFDLMVERINTDLANILGNLVNRTLSMSQKYMGGTVTNPKVSEPVDLELIEQASQLASKIEQQMDGFRVADAIDEIIDVLRRCNKYIDETTPWVLGKDEEKKERLNTVLYNLLETIRICAIHLTPYLPETAEKILIQLQTKETTLESTKVFGQLEVNHAITEKPEILFARIDLEEAAAKFDEMREGPKLKVEHKPEIAFDDFGKMELRTGTILSCKEHPKAERLLISQIDMGYEVIQVVSGIKPNYTPEMMVNKKVIVVVNLKEATIRGEKSQGMLLVAESEASDVIEVLEVSNQAIEKGSQIR